MSGGARNRFDGQRWREELLRKRTKEALKCFPAAERHLHYNEEYKRQEAIYRQERDAKSAPKERCMRGGCSSRQKSVRRIRPQTRKERLQVKAHNNLFAQSELGTDLR